MNKYQLTAKELNKLPTLCEGQFDNLKIETEDTRIWVSRCRVEYGEPYNDKISVEKFVEGRWEIDKIYQG